MWGWESPHTRTGLGLVRILTHEKNLFEFFIHLIYNSPSLAFTYYYANLL